MCTGECWGERERERERGKERVGEGVGEREAERESERSCIMEKTDSGVIALFEAAVPRQHWRGSAKDSRTHPCQSICMRLQREEEGRQEERWASRWMTGVGG